MGCLYMLIFPNGKQYIGITTQTADARFRRHVKRSRSGGTVAVNNAIRKFSPTSITVRTLVVASDWPYLCALEQRAIRAYKTRAPHGYNLTDGGEGVPGLSVPQATRKQISAANKGRVLTPEQRAKISAALRERPPPSAETRAKLAAANRGRTLTEDQRKRSGAANVGRVITDEAKAKQRATVLAKGGGVCFDKARGKWLAYVKIARKTTILGRFHTPEQARAARNEKLVALGWL